LYRGDRIRLKFGASVDQIGEVLRTRGERVEFLMRLLGRKVRCIAPVHALELVATRSRAAVRQPWPETCQTR
jgi:transcription antitermination factor NusA-like protein